MLYEGLLGAREIGFLCPPWSVAMVSCPTCYFIKLNETKLALGQRVPHSNSTVPESPGTGRVASWKEPRLRIRAFVGSVFSSVKWDFIFGSPHHVAEGV